MKTTSARGYLAAALATAGLLVGCATLANTPAQERTLAKVQTCGGNSLNIYVHPDGSWQGSAAQMTMENRTFVACMGGRW